MIKVELPDGVESPGGEETRGWGPPFAGEDHSAYFDGPNRNKQRDGYRSVGIPIKLSDTPGSVRFGPRPRGADTDSVLAEFGVERSQADALRQAGVVSASDTGTGTTDLGTLDQ